MLSCFKITANRFKNSYKLVIIDSPWFPIILNFSLYAIIQDLTPYTTERNKYHFIYHNSFRYVFFNQTYWWRCRAQKYIVFLYFWNTHLRLIGRKSPIVIYKETTFKQVNFTSKHKQRFLFGQFGCQIKPIKLLSASDVWYGQLYS